jgi:hypothetical protein
VADPVEERVVERGGGAKLGLGGGGLSPVIKEVRGSTDGAARRQGRHLGCGQGRSARGAEGRGGGEKPPT